MSTLSSTLLLIQKNTLLTLSWIYLAFGATGCFLNICLFGRKQFRITSCSTYFLAASVGMLLHLLFYAVPSIYGYYYANPITYNTGYCKFRSYFNHITSVIFRWVLTAASFDRFAQSSSNARLRRLADVRFAYRVIVAIVITVLVLNAYMLFMYGIQANTCFNTANAIWLTLLTIFALFNNFFLPATFMVAFTLLIRKNLKEKRERRQAVTNQQGATSQNGQIQLQRDQQVLRMLFTQIIAYFVITTPLVIYSVNNIISPYVLNKSADRIAIESFITIVTGGLSYLFPSVSFYLYTLTSNMFRRELWLMLRSWFRCYCLMRNHRVTPILTNEM